MALIVGFFFKELDTPIKEEGPKQTRYQFRLDPRGVAEFALKKLGVKHKLAQFNVPGLGDVSASVAQFVDASISDNLTEILSGVTACVSRLREEFGSEMLKQLQKTNQATPTKLHQRAPAGSPKNLVSD